MKFSTEYQYAYECVGGEKPGARALQNFLLEEIGQAPGVETVDSGIYNCRPIRGGRGMSTHSEGRALDTGFRFPGGGWPTEEIKEPAIWMWMDRLIERAECLGVLYIIYARKSRRPGAGWKPYRGSSPHFDHAHIELSRQAAAALTPEYVRKVLTFEEEEMSRHSEVALAYQAVNDVYVRFGGRDIESPSALEFQLNRYLRSDDPVSALVELATELDNE